MYDQHAHLGRRPDESLRHSERAAARNAAALASTAINTAALASTAITTAALAASAAARRHDVYPRYQGWLYLLRSVLRHLRRR